MKGRGVEKSRAEILRRRVILIVRRDQPKHRCRLREISGYGCLRSHHRACVFGTRSNRKRRGHGFLITKDALKRFAGLAFESRHNRV